jgi:aspartate aminotransferase-like enzyme
MASFSEQFLEIAERMEGKGWYFDVSKYVKYQGKKKGTPSTPPMPQVFGMNTILRIVDKMGGKNTLLDIYKKRSTMIRDGVRDIGLGILAEEGYESPTITAVHTPEGISGTEVYEAMRDRGIELAKGYGAVKETTFRIGNMGYMPFESIQEMLANLGQVMEELRS